MLSLVETSELYIFDIWNDNLQSFNREKNEASVPVFYADWTSAPVPRTSSLRGLDVGFIPLLPKELPYMANNDEYTDEYNDDYLCRDFFVGFQFFVEVIIPDIRISSSLVKTSCKATSTFWSCYANISVFIDRKNNKFLKKWITKYHYSFLVLMI